MGVFAANAHSFFNVSWSEFLVKANNILTDVFESNDVLGFLSAGVDDLSAATDHKTFFTLHHLFVLR
jgi:hypothetical protein